VLREAPSSSRARRPARLRPGVLALGIVTVVSLSAASCDHDTKGVSVGSATTGTVDEIVEAPGSVTARAAATLSAPAAGTLTDLRVEAGDQVRKGDVVAIIDSPELEARRDSAAKALDQAARGGGTPSVSLAGYTTVRKRTDKQAASAFDDARAAAGKVTDPQTKAVLLKQVDAAEKQYQAASATAAAALRSVQRGVASLGQAVGALSAAQKLQAQQAYDLANAAVEALTLRAPVSGVVQLGGAAPGGSSSLGDLISSASAGGAAPAAPAATTSLPGVDEAVPQGAYVAAGTPIVTIVDVSRLGLVAEVDETDVLLVKPGVAATVELDAASGVTYHASVRAIDLLPTTSARGGVSYRVRLDLTAGSPTPRPGMSAVVRLQVRQAAGAVTVPASAIVNADGQDTVWAVQDGRYRRVPVRLGVQGEDVVQVTSGVTAGQRIVVAGADQVHAGDKAS
jgi:multidrug efflux pump subunit AcrA (membrane-fusion protein)